MVKVVGIILALIPTLLGIYFAWGAYQGVAAFRPISLSPQVDATLAVACFGLALVILQIAKWLEPHENSTQ